MTMVDLGDIHRRIAAALPGARIEGTDTTGGDHLEVSVTAPQFAGKGLVEQQQMVYAALGDLEGGAP
jgi:stress-induced morphogen